MDKRKLLTLLGTLGAGGLIWYGITRSRATQPQAPQAPPAQPGCDVVYSKNLSPCFLYRGVRCDNNYCYIELINNCDVAVDVEVTGPGVSEPGTHHVLPGNTHRIDVACEHLNDVKVSFPKPPSPPPPPPPPKEYRIITASLTADRNPCYVGETITFTDKVTLNAVPSDPIYVHVRIDGTDPNGKHVDIWEGNIKIVNSRTGTTRFRKTFNVAGDWVLNCVYTLGNQKYTHPYHVLVYKLPGVGAVGVKEVQLMKKEPIEVFEGSDVWVTARAVFSRMIPYPPAFPHEKTLYEAYVPLQLLVDGNVVDGTWEKCHSGDLGTDWHNLRWGNASSGIHELRVRTCSMIPYSTHASKFECREWVTSEPITAKVLKVEWDKSVSKVIDPQNKIAVFTLEEGKYLIQCERVGDMHPRVIIVTEDYPPGDTWAKELLKDVIVEVSPPFRRVVSVDRGTHKVYVKISCGEGKWRVTIYPIAI